MKICIKAEEKSNRWQLQGARKINIKASKSRRARKQFAEEWIWAISPFLSVETFLYRSLCLTLNNEKSALISLLDDCDEFVAIDDIGDSDSSSILQMSSSLVAFAVLVVGGSTANGKPWELMNVKGKRRENK